MFTVDKQYVNLNYSYLITLKGGYSFEDFKYKTIYTSHLL